MFGTIESDGRQVRDHVRTDTGEHALSFGHYIYVIEHCEQFCTGRVYGTYDRPTAVGEILEQRHAL